MAQKQNELPGPLLRHSKVTSSTQVFTLGSSPNFPDKHTLHPGSCFNLLCLLLLTPSSKEIAFIDTAALEFTSINF